VAAPNLMSSAHFGGGGAQFAFPHTIFVVPDASFESAKTKWS
jgi:hypothetical protein